MQQPIIIGRKGDQKLNIPERTVSGRHCSLTPTGAGRWLLEDLGSTNGTYINDIRIASQEVTVSTEVKLGPKFKATVGELLGLTDVSKEREPQTPLQQPADAIDISGLKDIYDTYKEAKLTIEKDMRRTQFMRQLPMLILPIVLLGASFLFGSSEAAQLAQKITSGVCVLALLLVGGKMWRDSSSMPEKLDQLNEQFKIDYVCPNCHSFFGQIPYEAVKNKKQCPFCKKKFKD